MKKLTATLEFSNDVIDDLMWPPREDRDDLPERLRFDRETGWWMKRDRRFKTGWRKLIERAPVGPDGSRLMRPRGLRTWRPGQKE